MVPVFVFVVLLILMVCVLLFPSSVNDIMRASIPVDARPKPPEYPFFPIILIFLLGIGLFYEIEHYWPSRRGVHLDSLQFVLSRLSAVLLAATGIFACIWPIRFTRMFVKELRRMTDSKIDAVGRGKIVLVAKGFGAMFIFASSYVVHLILTAK
jgi:hypothetical protein